MRLALIWLLALAACAPSEEEMPMALAEAECAHLVGCFPAAWPTFDACVNERTPAAAATGSYDADAARDCLNELDDLVCSDGESPPEWPESCDVVWSE